MKKLFITAVAIFAIISQVLAQSPQSFKYQAVVRDGAGTVIANQIVGFQLSILQTSETGSSVYTETFTTTTNSYGLVNLNIGEGTPVSGDFSTIDWAADSYYLKVELDETGGTNYTHIGTSKLNSVPYALHANTAGNVFSGDYNDLSNTPDLSNYDTDVTDDFDGDYTSLTNKPTLAGDVVGDIEANTVEKIQGKNVSINTPTTGQVLKWNGTEWAPAEDDVTGGSGTDGVVNSASFSGTTNKTLTLGRSNGLLSITANFTDEVNDADADATNELITSATLNGTNLEITDAGGTKTVNLSSLDNSGTDSQTLSVSGTDLTISNGNTVTLQDNVDDADADPNNELQVLNLSNDTLYLSDGGQVYMGNYGNLWSTHGNDIYNNNNGYVGVGTDAPTGKFVVKGDSVNLDTALFEVRNAAGQPIFAVYDGGVRVWVDNTINKANNDKGGFAIGGYRLDKTETHELFRITADSARVYYDNENTGAGLSGGFAIESFEGTGGTDAGGTMHLSEDNYFIGQHSGENLTTGIYNSTFGYKTGELLTSAQKNVFIGYLAGDSTTTGSENIFIGTYSGLNNSNGNANNFIGTQAGESNTTGNYNNFIGRWAG